MVFCWFMQGGVLHKEIFYGKQMALFKMRLDGNGRLETARGKLPKRRRTPLMDQRF
jgi:hypothetical protein